MSDQQQKLLHKYFKKVDRIILDLKLQIEQKGYYGNMGINEMRLLEDEIMKEDQLNYRNFSALMCYAWTEINNI